MVDAERREEAQRERGMRYGRSRFMVDGCDGGWWYVG
jgi:hypothetical protein